MVVSRSTQLSCFLGVLLVFLAFVHRGWAIYCWRCNSAYDPNCADPFNNITSDLVNCDMRSREHLPPEKKAVVCRKIVQKVYSDFRYVRDCGWLREEKEGASCMRRAGTFSVLMKYCSCEQDGCNGGPYLRAAPSWILALVAAATAAASASPRVFK
uniref:Uncharacterized protein n=1 Tax=Ixodes ricinus TaxID=34613 RepID=A0A147BNT5_IXORI